MARISKIVNGRIKFFDVDEGGATSIVTSETVTASSWSTGNNATFLAGTTLAGTFANSATTTINDVDSYSYTQASGSLNDWAASPAIKVPLRSRGKTNYIRLPYLYDGANDDIKMVVYDDTNSTIISSASDLIKNATTTTSEIIVQVNMPSTCQNIKIGFHVLVENVGKILVFDDIEILDRPSGGTETQTLSYNTGNQHGSTNTKVRRFLNNPTNSGASILTPTDSATDGLYFTATKKCRVFVAYSDTFQAASAMGITLNSSELTTNIDELTNEGDRKAVAALTVADFIQQVFWAGELNTNDVIRCHTKGDNDSQVNDDNAVLEILAIADV